MHTLVQFPAEGTHIIGRPY